MMIFYGFEVWEHYNDPDQCPEPFGEELFDHVPAVGEIITLHWLDGKVAYQLRVLSVDRDRFRIEAQHLPKLLEVKP